jgi:glycerate 2-kinase
MRALVEIYEDVTGRLDARALARGAAGKIPSPRGGRLFVFGLGKVAAELFLGVRDVVGPAAAVLVVPRDAPAPEGAKVLRGSHPLPDAGSIEGGEALLASAAALAPEDAALVLVSGGGSSLAEAPRTGLTLEDLREINQALLGSGLPIEEMNCVRAHLSRLKGGGLARALHQAGVTRARALVAVDVARGGPAAVSSGPAAADPTTSADALKLVRDHRLPAAATRVHETLKPGEAADFIEHLVLCDMRSPAVLAAQVSGATLLDSPIYGTVEEVADRFSGLKGFFAASGEAELRLPPGAPPGGRDQHLALVLAKRFRGKSAFQFLAAGTDGRDGPTAAAGAIVDGATWTGAERRGLDPERALREFDASRVLSELGLLIPARHRSSHAGDLFLLRA